jgi:AhpD family alkylhydroperoxidase
MEHRIDYYDASPAAMHALLALEIAVAGCGLDSSLLQLVKLRASQINKCAFCIDLESVEALRCGESARRLSALVQWRDSTLFTAQERAALAWTEQLTKLNSNAAADETFALLSRSFTEKQMVDLTLAIGAINAWNRMGVGFRRALC